MHQASKVVIGRFVAGICEAKPPVELVDGSRALAAAAAALGASVQGLRTYPEFQRYLVQRGEESAIVDLVVGRVVDVDAAEVVGPGVRIHSLREIAANKVCALLGRGEIRDLIDLRAILASGHRLEDAMQDAERKDGGVSAATLAWLLAGLRIGAQVQLPGVTAAELDQFRLDLVSHEPARRPVGGQRGDVRRPCVATPGRRARRRAAQPRRGDVRDRSAPPRHAGRPDDRDGPGGDRDGRMLAGSGVAGPGWRGAGRPRRGARPTRRPPAAAAGWRYGCSTRWMLADAMLRTAAIHQDLAASAALPWPHRETQIESELGVLQASGNPVTAVIAPNLVSAERCLRESATLVRLLRMSVALHRGLRVPPLDDPLGDGPLRVTPEAEQGMRLSDAASELRPNLARLVAR